MDILAARKKAAERAKAFSSAEKPEAAEKTAAPEAPAREQLAVQPGPLALHAHTESSLSLPQEPAAAEAADSDEQQEGAAVPSAEAEQELEMLSVLLGRELYAVPVDHAREVLTVREITPVPHTPEYLLGVSSLRGSVLPVIDLKQRLGIARTDIDDKTRIVVAGLEADDRIGLLVDRVRGVVRFPAGAIRPVPETVEQGAEFLSGIVRQDDRLIIVLDVAKVSAV